MGYYEFPHTRNYDTDLGYLIKRYFELNADFESLEKNFNDLKAWCLSQLNSEALKTLVANKLDEWLADGTLEALINNPLNHVTTYDTVVEMLPHSGLLEGSKIYCTGADTVNDGKGGHFRIRARLSTDVIDNYNLYLIDGGVKVAERLIELNNRKILLISDSYGDTYDDIIGWVDRVAEQITNATFIKKPQGGAGFNGTGIYSFTNILTSVTDSDITDIVVCGGYNDGNLTNLATNIDRFFTTAKQKYPKAAIYVGYVGWDCTSTDRSRFIYGYNIYKERCLANGGAFMVHVWDIMHTYVTDSENAVYLSYEPDNPLSFHPSNVGTKAIANAIVSYLQGGDYLMNIITPSLSLTANIGRVFSDGIFCYTDGMIKKISNKGFLTYNFDGSLQTINANNTPFLLGSISNTVMQGDTLNCTNTPVTVSLHLNDNTNVTTSGTLILNNFKLYLALTNMESSGGNWKTFNNVEYLIINDFTLYSNFLTD